MISWIVGRNRIKITSCSSKLWKERRYAEILKKIIKPSKTRIDSKSELLKTTFPIFWMNTPCFFLNQRKKNIEIISVTKAKLNNVSLCSEKPKIRAFWDSDGINNNWMILIIAPSPEIMIKPYRKEILFFIVRTPSSGRIILD